MPFRAGPTSAQQQQDAEGRSRASAATLSPSDFMKVGHEIRHGIYLLPPSCRELHPYCDVSVPEANGLAVDLVRRLLTVDRSRRASVAEALSHAWVTSVPNTMLPADTREALHRSMQLHAANALGGSSSPLRVTAPSPSMSLRGTLRENSRDANSNSNAQVTLRSSQAGGRPYSMLIAPSKVPANALSSHGPSSLAGGHRPSISTPAHLSQAHQHEASNASITPSVSRQSSSSALANKPMEEQQQQQQNEREMQAYRAGKMYRQNMLLNTDLGIGMSMALGDTSPRGSISGSTTRDSVAYDNLPATPVGANEFSTLPRGVAGSPQKQHANATLHNALGRGITPAASALAISGGAHSHRRQSAVQARAHRVQSTATMFDGNGGGDASMSMSTERNPRSMSIPDVAMSSSEALNELISDTTAGNNQDSSVFTSVCVRLCTAASRFYLHKLIDS